MSLVAALPMYGQGTVGFSSQTQPAELRGAQTINKNTFQNFTALPQATKATTLQAAFTAALAPAQVTALKRTKPVPTAFLSAVPDTSLSIAESSKLLEAFDDLQTKSEARRGLGNWRVGIVSDGDFNKPITSAIATGKAGSLGIDAVFLKDVYTRYIYYLNDADDKEIATLEGWQHVARPRVALSTLVVLFAGASPLGTGIPPGGSKPPVAVNLDLQRTFGQALLIPNGYVAGNGLSFSSNVTYYFDKFGTTSIQSGLSEAGRLGLSASVVAVQSNWRTRDTTTVVNILAPSIGLVYRAVEGHLKVGNQDNYAQVQPFVRYTMRHLFGDVETIWGGRLLTDALGTDQRTYHALDIGVMFSINAVRLTTNVPIFFGKKIEGFSRGQLIAGFGLAATIPIN